MKSRQFQPVALERILEALDGAHHVEGCASATADKFASTWDADETCLTFVAHDRSDKASLLAACNGRIVVCDDATSVAADRLRVQTYICTANPKLQFTRAVNRCFALPTAPSIASSASIDPDAKIDPTCSIGNHCRIGRASIGAYSVVGDGVVVGDDVSIGAYVRIGAGCVIGGSGFGHLRNSDGSIEEFPHIGGVEIQDHVTIGGNTCVDRGALGVTVIGEGSKVDNLVHVAHNVVIGRHCMVVALTMIGGSTRIGDYAYVAPSVTLRDDISIGRSALVGLGALVTKSVPDGEVWMGFPARKIGPA